MARIDCLGLLSLAEVKTLSINLNHACKAAIEHLWGDTSLAVERAGALSDWVWHRLLKTSILALEQIEGGNQGHWIKDIISLRLGNFFIPITIQSQERRVQFADWIEQSVLKPLQPANSVLIETALETICHAISALEGDQKAYGNLFLEQLPSSAFNMIISKNPEFAERRGFKTTSVIEIGAEIKLLDSELVKAVREIFTTNKQKTIQDVLGKDVSISLDPKSQEIALGWTDTEGASQNVSIPRSDHIFTHPGKSEQLTPKYR